MPLLATLIKSLFGNMYAMMLLLQSTRDGIRLMAIGILAAAYIACASFFTLFIAPLLLKLFTSSYGQVLGLAFPPISGTVIAGIIGLWGCIVTKRYYYKFSALALPK